MADRRDPAALSPGDTARQFTYSPLDLDSNEVRLLRLFPPAASSSKVNGVPEIICELFHEPRHSDIYYSALSYTWGLETDPHYPISLNGRHFDVRENLWLALDQLRRGRRELVIWIDALCINQDDIAERNDQVAKMRQIYEQAEEVVVWLGPAGDDSDEVFDIVQELYDYRLSRRWLFERFNQPDMAGLLEALADLLYRPYWSRLWIVQEIVSARSIYIHCGGRSFSGNVLATVQRLLQTIYARNDSANNSIFKRFFHNNLSSSATVRMGGLREILDWKTTSNSRTTLFQAILYHENRLASDPRDMIYGISGLVHQDLQYQVNVDYALSPKEVFTRFAREEILNTKTSSLLTRTWRKSNELALPSWVPDWRTIKSRRDHSYLYRPGPSSQSFEASRERAAIVSFNQEAKVMMTLAGIYLGTIKILGEKTNMQHSADDANCTTPFMGWWNQARELLGEKDNTFQARFARTIYCANDQKFPIINEQAVTRESYFLGGFADIHQELFPGTTLDPVLERCRAIAAPEGLDSQRTAARTGVMDTGNLIIDRRVFYADNGLLGMAPDYAQEGDIVCVPLGCSEPILLRKVEDHYVSLGEAYVDEYMYGKAVDELERGERELRTYELH